MVMSPDDRAWILKKEWNVSQKDIAAAVRQATKVKNQRRQTILMDGDVFWNRISRAMEALEGCVKPITNAWKNGDDAQLDWMNVAPDCTQKGTLDATRHRGVTFTIEDEEADRQPESAKDSDGGVGRDDDHLLFKKELDRDDEQTGTVDTSTSTLCLP